MNSGSSRKPRALICLTLDHRSRRRKSRYREANGLNGFGVFEIALPFKGDAFRVVYAVQLAEEIWVVHAFQKKSTKGIKTPA